MKLLAGLLFIASSAWACPDLTGYYKSCKNLTTGMTNTADLKITQRVSRRVQIYTFTSIDQQTGEEYTENFSANGKFKIQSQRDPESGDTVTLKTKVSCANEELKSQMDLYYNEELVSQIFTSFVKRDHQLFQVVTYVDQGKEKVEETICE